MFLKKSENITKLRELTDMLCKSDYEDIDKYKEIIEEIQTVIEAEDNIIQAQKSQNSKLKCYESMCSKIKIILNKLKLA